MASLDDFNSIGGVGGLKNKPTDVENSKVNYYDESKNNFGYSQISYNLDKDIQKFRYVKYDSKTDPDFDGENFKNANVGNFDYDDPTFLGIDLVLNKNTPLFSNKNKNAGTTAYSFLIDYSTYKSVLVRKKIYSNFIKVIQKIFKFDTKEGNFVDVKNYYINSVAGLGNLNKKIVNYGEDKITITLSEDVSMFSLYLAELYNNLVYDYKNQKYIIPDNCLKFDLKLRISDLRVFKLLSNKNGSKVDAINNKLISSQIYILRDCNFDFFNSQIHDDIISIGGFGAAKNDNAATLKFDIYYKSIEREIQPLLIEDKLLINNKSKEPMNPANLNKNNIGFEHIIKNDEELLKYPNSIISGLDEKSKKYGNINDKLNIGNKIDGKFKKKDLPDLEKSINKFKTGVKDDGKFKKKDLPDLEKSINKFKTGVKDYGKNLVEYAKDYAINKTNEIIKKVKNTLYNLLLAEIRDNILTSELDRENVYEYDLSKVNYYKKFGEDLLNIQIPTTWGDLRSQVYRTGLNELNK